MKHKVIMLAQYKNYPASTFQIFEAEKAVELVRTGYAKFYSVVVDKPKPEKVEVKPEEKTEEDIKEQPKRRGRPPKENATAEPISEKAVNN